MREGHRDIKLRPGEVVCWTGRPIPSCCAVKDWWYQLPLGLLFIGTGTIWTGITLSIANTPWFFALPGAAFAVVGLDECVRRPLWRGYQAQGSTYVVTDQRVVIRYSTLWRRRERQYDISRLPCVGICTRAGPGDVLLDEEPRGTGESAAFDAGLWCIADARSVYDLLARLRGGR